jgi:transcription elongation factor GreA
MAMGTKPHCLPLAAPQRSIGEQCAGKGGSMVGGTGVIQVGSRVCVRDTDDRVEFDIVEPHEADIAEARISAESPLGRALLGRQVGDEVRYRAPGGVLSVTVVEVGG